VALLAERELGPRAMLIARRAAELLPGCAAVVYAIENPEAPAWTHKATVGEVRVEEAVLAIDQGTLGALGTALAEQQTALILSAENLRREDYAHLTVRRTLVSMAYLPLFNNQNQEVLVGALELASFEEPLTEELLSGLGELVQVAGPALGSAIAYEQERNSNLQSISRLAQFYDVEKVFNATLEMDELLPLITEKFQQMLSAQAVHLWMVGGDGELLLTSTAGNDPTVEEGSVQRSGEGIAALVSDSGEPLVIESPEHELLQARNQGVEDGAIFTVMAAPVLAQEKQVAVVEAINKMDGAPFDEDDVFLLTTICESAGGALHNASLLQAERKAEILETLVKVSTEITSTLNLDRVLQTVVNGPGAVVPYERAAIALEQRGRLQLKAISGMEQINPEDPDVGRLRGLLQWASMLNEEILVTQKEEEISADREETRAKFERYFAESGMRGFYALPLLDQEGRVGILSFESSNPDFLSEVHFEMIKVLAGQATVALRNATLYQEVPFIGVLEPLLQKKQKFLAMEGRKRATVLALAALGATFLALFPLPMRVDGGAVVTPARTAQVEPEIDGVVRRVFVHEGSYVARGEVLADLEDWDYRGALNAVQAKYQTAASEANRALAANDGAEAGIQQVQAQYWGSEVKRAQERLEKTHLRSPIAGWVTTPHIENLVGSKLAAGDNFAEVADSSSADIDVAVDENDLSLVTTAQGKGEVPAAIKLEGYPTRTFRGTVMVVSPKSHTEEDARAFYARVSVSNKDNLMRPGMQGRGKISVGWHPVGFVFLRRPAMWLYSRVWSWMGW